jgi:hypothetical protein
LIASKSSLATRPAWLQAASNQRERKAASQYHSRLARSYTSTPPAGRRNRTKATSNGEGPRLLSSELRPVQRPGPGQGRQDQLEASDPEARTRGIQIQWVGRGAPATATRHAPRVGPPS